MNTSTVQNLVTIWDVLQGRVLVLAEESEGCIFTYDPRKGELGVWSITYNSRQGAGWWLRTTRSVAKHLPFPRAVELASVWSVEWRDPQ
jgi:hypothetical protein